MVNIYDTANQLAEELQKTPEYAKLQEGVTAVKADPAALKLYRQMDELQKKFMTMQQSGQTPGQEDRMRYQTLNQELQANATMADLMKKEQATYDLLNELQEIFTKPLSNAYAELTEPGQ